MKTWIGSIRNCLYPGTHVKRRKSRMKLLLKTSRFGKKSVFILIIITLLPELEEIFNPCLSVEIGWHAVRNIFFHKGNIKLTVLKATLKE